MHMSYAVHQSPCTEFHLGLRTPAHHFPYISDFSVQFPSQQLHLDKWNTLNNKLLSLAPNLLPPVLLSLALFLATPYFKSLRQNSRVSDSSANPVYPIFKIHPISEYLSPPLLPSLWNKITSIFNLGHCCISSAAYCRPCLPPGLSDPLRLLLNQGTPLTKILQR